MADVETRLAFKVGTPVWSPLSAEVAVDVQRRWVQRGQDAVESLVERVAPELLAQRLQESPELDALLTRAVQMAADTALPAKRRLLGRVVARAVLDDAEIDEATFIVEALRDLEPPHARCLEAIGRAEQEAGEHGELEPVAPKAEQPIIQRIHDVAAQYPGPVFVTLDRAGLVDVLLSHDGVLALKGLTSLGRIVLNDLRDAAESGRQADD